MLLALICSPTNTDPLMVSFWPNWIGSGVKLNDDTATGTADILHLDQENLPWSAGPWFVKSVVSSNCGSNESKSIWKNQTIEQNYRNMNHNVGYFSFDRRENSWRIVRRFLAPPGATTIRRKDCSVCQEGSTGEPRNASTVDWLLF